MSSDKKTDSLQPEEIRSTGSPPLSANHESRTDGAASSVAVGSVSTKKPQGFFADRPLTAIEMTPERLRHLTRRDVLLFGAGAVVALAGAGFLLPQDTLSRLGVRRNMDSPGKEWFLNKALRKAADKSPIFAGVGEKYFLAELLGPRHYGPLRRPVSRHER